MTRFITTITVLVILMLHTLSANAAGNPQLVTIQTFLQQNHANDPVALSYVSLRCSALYLTLSAMLVDETDSERQRTKESWKKTSLSFQGMAAHLRIVGTTTTLVDAAKGIGPELTAISLLYNDRIKQVHILGINMFSDELIGGDFNFCKGIAEQAR